jgi:hypothetical protein
MAIKYVGGKIKRIHSRSIKRYKKIKEKRIIEPVPKVNVWHKLNVGLKRLMCLKVD